MTSPNHGFMDDCQALTNVFAKQYLYCSSQQAEIGEQLRLREREREAADERRHPAIDASIRTLNTTIQGYDLVKKELESLLRMATDSKPASTPEFDVDFTREDIISVCRRISAPVGRLGPDSVLNYKLELPTDKTTDTTAINTEEQINQEIENV